MASSWDSVRTAHDVCPMQKANQRIDQRKSGIGRRLAGIPPPSPRVPPKGSVLKMTSQPRWQRSVILKGMRRLDRLAGGTAHKTPRHYWNCFVLSSLFLWAAFSRASRTLLRPLSYLIDFLYIRVIVRGDASFWDAKLLRPSILYRWRVKLRDTSSFHCQTDPVAKPHAAYFSANDNREVA